MYELPFAPPAASTYAEEMDKLFYVLVALTVFFTVAVAIVMLIFTVYYRRGNNVDRSRPVSHNTQLEIAWSVGPLILALGVFVWSTKLFTTAYAAPPNAKEIFVIGKQWMWHIQHSNGIRENNELHIPVGEPIKLTMISQDVIHAFFVPEFRLQRHVEPGHYSTMWFTPTKVGRYHLYCNMYCGTQHSQMGGWVYVMSKQDYAKWSTSGGSKPVAPAGITAPTGGLNLAQTGAALYQQYECASCHSPQAVARKRGPSLVGIYGKMRQLQNGKTVRADDNYLRNVLYYPNEYALAGWPQGMPTYKGYLTEDQVVAINTYIKSLSAPYNAGTAGAGAGTTPPGPSGAAVPGETGEPVDTDGGAPGVPTPATETDNQQWRYMYGGEQYK